MMEILKLLSGIEEQGRKIDATIGSLRDVTEIKISDYNTIGTVKMLDIGDEIQERLVQTGGKSD